MARPGPKVRLIVSAGQIFGRLTVLDPNTRDAGGRRAARCRCACGREAVVAIKYMVAGRTRSCGCIHAERARDLGRANHAHGLTGNPLYKTWVNMMQRCENPEDAAYKNYGGRGIEVCDRWHDVRLFITDIEREIGLRPDGMTLDRINNNSGYRAGNVKWSTVTEQMNNTRANSRRQARAEMASEMTAQMAGRPRHEIADAMGVSRASVRLYVGNVRRSTLAERVEQARGLAGKGMLQREIAEVMGVTQTSVSNYLRRA